MNNAPVLSKQEFDKLMVQLNIILEEHRKTATNDYASEFNVFDNFIRLGERLEEPPLKVLGQYYLKHEDTIERWFKGGESQRESIEGRIEDAINYLKLAWAFAVVTKRINPDPNE
jgi:hypothetical protein